MNASSTAFNTKLEAPDTQKFGFICFASLIKEIENETNTRNERGQFRERYTEREAETRLTRQMHI